MRKAFSARRAPFAGLTALAAVVVVAVYQARAPIALDMASGEESRYLSGFYPPEATAGVTYRWTDGEARIALPGLGRGARMHLRINLQAIRPEAKPLPPVTIRVNGREIDHLTPKPELSAYDFDLAAEAIGWNGDLIIDLQSDTFVPRESGLGDDARRLGLLIDRVEVEFGAGLIIPSLWVWAWLAISVSSMYALVWLIGGGRRAGWLAAFALIVAEAFAIGVDRAWTGYQAPWLAGTLVISCLVALRLKRRDTYSSIDNVSFILRLTPSMLAFLAAVFLAWRIALVVIPLVGSSIVGVPECCPQVDPVPVASLYQAAFGHWHRWDALWYGSIAQNGYQYFGEREASNTGFFPLFPIFTGALARVLGLPVEVAGPILSTLLAFIACVLLYRLAQGETDDDAVASRTVVYLLTFPAAYYLAIGYSEALYLFCVLAAFWWARTGRWAGAGAAAFLAGLTRLHGALLIAPLGYEYLRQRGFHWRSIRADALAVIAAPLGMLAFNLYLNLQFGQPDGHFSPYFEIQTLFFKGSRAEAFPTFPTTTLASYLGGLLNGAPTTEGVVVVGAMILLLILTLEVWVRLPRVYGVYMLVVALFSLIGGDLISMPRFVAPMFPGFIALALIGRRAWVDRAILIASAALLGVLAAMFTRGYWIA